MGRDLITSALSGLDHPDRASLLAKSRHTGGQNILKAKRKLTQKQYVAHKGIRCPWCHCTEIGGGRPIVDDDGITQDITCNGCGRVWQDIYKLTGYRIYK